MMTAKAFALCFLAAFAAPAFSETRVDLSAVVGKDFISSPSLDQAVEAVKSESLFGGFGYEVVMRHIGIGCIYLADFSKDGSGSWWLDWNAQAAYASYHFFGARAIIDPFVDAGLGCAGRVFLGPGDAAGARLAIGLYPFASAGATVDLGGIRLGAKLSYALDRSGIPATSIPDYPLGRFQAYASASLSLPPR